MIDHLTPEQEALLPVYRDKWRKIGLDTSRHVDNPRLVAAFYQLWGHPAPTRCLWCPSPIAAWGMVCSDEVGDEVGDEVRMVKYAVWDEVEHAIWYEIGTIRAAVKAAVWNAVGNAVWAVKAAVKAAVRDTDFFYPHWDGNMNAAWIGFFDFMEHVVGMSLGQDAEKFAILREMCAYSGLCWPLKTVCVFSEKPTAIRWNGEGQLHHEGGMAIEYADGWGVHCLHGVQVPAWLAETPAMQIDPKRFAELHNVEQRREFVRKVGMERIVQAVGGHCLDTVGEYELLLCDLGEGVGQWPYLKMRNPSLGVWHLECVGRECRTVQSALNFRAAHMKSLTTDWLPMSLS